MNRYIMIAAMICILLSPWSLPARTLLKYTGSEDMSHDTTYTFTVTLSEPGSYIIMDARSDLERGRLTIWLGGGGYDVIGEYTNKGTFVYDAVRFGPLSNREEITVRITARHARGTWSMDIEEYTRSTAAYSLGGSGALIFLIAALFIFVWVKKCRLSLRWLFLGALIWFAGIVTKFICAYFLNTPILTALDSAMPQYGYLITGSLYIGSLTGIFEIGVTLVFAIFMRSLYADKCRAAGVGVGAGTIEALLLGLSQFISIGIIFSSFPGTDEILGRLVTASAHTPVFVLVAPVERLMVIPCHIAARMFVLQSVRAKKPLLFWAAFILMTLIDAIAGYVHLSGLMNTASMWWSELLILPFAALSMFMIRWSRRTWPLADPSPCTHQNSRQEGE